MSVEENFDIFSKILSDLEIKHLGDMYRNG